MRPSTLPGNTHSISPYTVAQHPPWQYTLNLTIQCGPAPCLAIHSHHTMWPSTLPGNTLSPYNVAQHPAWQYTLTIQCGPAPCLAIHSHHTMWPSTLPGNTLSPYNVAQYPAWQYTLTIQCGPVPCLVILNLISSHTGSVSHSRHNFVNLAIHKVGCQSGD